MRAQIKKWGDSASVQIPEPLMISAALQMDQTVEITEEGGRIIIQPVPSPSRELDRLVEAMDPRTFPEEVDFGPPRGGEAW